MAYDLVFVAYWIGMFNLKTQRQTRARHTGMYYHSRFSHVDPV